MCLTSVACGADVAHGDNKIPRRVEDPRCFIGVVDCGGIMLRSAQPAAATGMSVVARIPIAALIVPLIAGLLATALTVVLPRPACAEHGTPVNYPAGATATRFGGAAFDTCTAPSLGTVKAWSASPYR